MAAKKTAATKATTQRRTGTTKAKSTKTSNRAAKTPDKATSATKPTGKGKANGTTDKGPGVIASIIEFVQAANAKLPITKSALRAKLLKRFPERGEVALGRTINCQLPSRLTSEKGLTIKTKQTDDGKGYWIP